MTTAQTTDPRSGLPEELVITDVRRRIREHNVRTRRRVAVLDDDPTGSQSVHGVQVVTVLERDVYADALSAAGETCFVLTNSRSLDEPEARALNHRVGRDLFSLEADLGGPVEIVSRSDSCLRGHVLAEITELADAAADEVGREIDGVLFVPALLSAGRFTVDDVHWAIIDDIPVPVAETEFAADATFGYRHSALPEFLAEISAGSVPADQVISLSLTDIRVGGPDRVAEVLAGAEHRQWIVVNAVGEHDLDVVALGLTLARESGHDYLYRTGPSFVRALSGLDPRPPLSAEQISCRSDGCGHGLIVVGSHTRATTRQLDLVRDRFAPVEVELDVSRLLDHRRDDHLAQTAARVRDALADQDVLLSTSRVLRSGADRAASLDIARQVSAGLIAVVAAAREARPSWVLAKGGITSHDVAVHGLGINRAEVVGQFAAGGISLFRPLDAPDTVRGMPYVVFPGNVGGPTSLAETVAVLVTAATARSTHTHRDQEARS